VSIFIAAFDETESSAGQFTLGGFIGPRADWRDHFSPAWCERVLAGPPAIPYLHMTDIRNDDWCRKHRITQTEAARRLDEAVRVIASTRSLCPIRASIDVAGFQTLLSQPLKKLGGFGNITKYPDYLAFIAFTVFTLRFVKDVIPEATRVDLLAEESQKTTQTLRGFHGHLQDTMSKFPTEVARLFGRFSSAGKESIPLQAADVFCWHLQRAHAGRLRRQDSIRLAKMTARLGPQCEITAEDVEAYSGQLQSEIVRRTR